MNQHQLIEDAVNAYYHQSLRELERNDLGDMERKNWEQIKKDCITFLNPIIGFAPATPSPLPEFGTKEFNDMCAHHFGGKSLPLPETETGVSVSVNWFMGLPVSRRIELSDTYFPEYKEDGSDLNDNEIHHIYLKETGAPPTPGNEAGAFDHLDHAADDLEIEELEKALWDEPTGAPVSKTETGVSVVEINGTKYRQSFYPDYVLPIDCDFPLILKSSIATTPTPGNERPESGEGFTPGPWEISYNTFDGGQAHGIYAFGEMDLKGAHIAIVNELPTLDKNTTEAHGKANARLIASAPDMFKIVKRAHFWFSNEANYPEGTGGYKMVKECEKILNSITGVKS